MPCAGLPSSPQRAEEFAQVLREELGLFEGREVSASRHPREAAQVVSALGPLARRQIDVSGQERDRARHLHALARREPPRRPVAIVVEPVGRGDGPGRPVDGEQGGHVVECEAAGGPPPAAPPPPRPPAPPAPPPPRPAPPPHTP